MVVTAGWEKGEIAGGRDPAGLSDQWDYLARGRHTLGFEQILSKLIIH